MKPNSTLDFDLALALGTSSAGGSGESASRFFHAMLFDTYHHFTPQDFIFRIARTPEAMLGYWDLRRAIFCDEQKIFRGDDRDELDERQPGVWYGSRLGVAADFRSVKKISPGVAMRNHQPVYRGLGALGAGLIYKAVSTAHALGCREFLATVQHQNARFFQRLHWEPLEELELFGIQHVKMRADLEYYRPAEAVF